LACSNLYVNIKAYDTIKELYSLIQVEDVVKQVLSGTIEDSEVEGGKKSFYLLNTCVISDTIMKDTIDAIIKTEKLLSLKVGT
jgi:hypothetical protein